MNARRGDPIKKRGSTWGFVVDGPPGPDGQRRQIRKGGFKTKAEAKSAHAELVTNFSKKTYVAPTKENLCAYLERWLAGRVLKPTTASGYEQLVRTQIKPKIGGIRLQDLDTGTLKAYYGELRKGGRLNGRGGLSPRTVQLIHTILRRALADAVEEKLITANPADFRDHPKAPKAREMRVWNKDQMRRFLNYVEGSKLEALSMLAATTGMRRGELAGVRWSDVDLEARRLQVAQTVVLVRAVVTFSTPKTDKGKRNIPLDAATVGALRAHRTRWLEAKLAKGADFKGLDLVFCLEDGSPIHPEAIANAFQAAARTAGLPVIRFHDLRHSYASIALMAGVPARVVADRLGHSDVKVTLGIYSHVLPGLAEAEAERVAAAILGG